MIEIEPQNLWKITSKDVNHIDADSGTTMKQVKCDMKVNVEILKVHSLSKCQYKIPDIVEFLFQSTLRIGLIH